MCEQVIFFCNAEIRLNLNFLLSLCTVEMVGVTCISVKFFPVIMQVMSCYFAVNE